MAEHYQVKFQLNGQTVYGVCFNSSAPRSKQLGKKGLVEVCDAVLPRTYEIPEKDLTDIPLSTEYDSKRGCMKDELSLYVADEFDKAEKLSNSLKGFQPGKLFYIGVGDGNAHYIVTEVGKRTCKIEWRGFGADRYTDQILGWGGTFKNTIIMQQVARCEGLAAIFGAKKS